MPNDLVLVRHGESEANLVQGIFKRDPHAEAPLGFYDIHDSEVPLSEQGARQAEATGTWLDYTFPGGFDRYYASPLMRTVETAGRLGLQGTWQLDDRWRERDWGEFGVLSPAKRQARYDVAVRLKEQNKWYWGPPGGESLATGVRLRFEDILETLHRETTERNVQQVIAVTHGEMIDVARFVLERLTPREWLRQDKDPAYKTSNCQVVHYTRLDPVTGQQAPRLQWRRSICAWDPSKSWDNGEWTEIEHHKYSDDDLLRMAAGARRFFAGSGEA